MNTTLHARTTDQNVLMDNGLLGKSARSVLLAVAITYAITWINWFLATWRASRAVAAAKQAGPEALKRAPMLPSVFPKVGHTLQFILDADAFLTKAA
jgi:hypothetical protein